MQATEAVKIQFEICRLKIKRRSAGGLRENQSEPKLENGFSQPSKKGKKEMKKEGKNILLDKRKND